MNRRWVVVIPVKGTKLAKSRLEIPEPTRSELALAFALDTVRAVLAAEQVAAVLVVTASAEAESAVRLLGADTLRETSNAGLNGCISQALGEALQSHPGAPVAVLLGDLPALRPEELDAALSAAATHPRAMVADSAGIGTVLVTALRPETHAVHFGGASRQAHRLAGYTELDVAAHTGLRHDIDTIDDLAAARALPLGESTRRVLSRVPA